MTVVVMPMPMVIPATISANGVYEIGKGPKAYEIEIIPPIIATSII